MAEQAQGWWREAIPRFGMRSLFHALCDLGRDDPPEPILDYASSQPWLADQAERFSQLSVLDRPHLYEPGDEQLWASLALLYAASRVRDVLLMAHQPAPANPGEVHDMDEMLGRNRPSSAAVPVARVTEFFRCAHHDHRPALAGPDDRRAGLYPRRGDRAGRGGPRAARRGGPFDDVLGALAAAPAHHRRVVRVGDQFAVADRIPPRLPDHPGQRLQPRCPVRPGTGPI
jgi:hypothetical protein